MILEINPDSSPLAHLAATTILYVHIGAGLASLVAGAMALVARKGSRGHRASGRMFVACMLIMAAIGAAVSPFLNPPQWVNVVAGTFTLYLVITGWMTVTRRGPPGRMEVAALLSALAIAAAALSTALAALNSVDPTVASDAAPAFVFAAIIALAAVGDARLLSRGSLSATQRLVRHLWRMCYGLTIATASLFMGQPQIFPQPMRESGLLFVPVIAVLGLMIFWIVRVRVARKAPSLSAATS